MVPGAGLEPARPYGQGILNPQCLPFHHPGVVNSQASERNIFLQGLIKAKLALSLASAKKRLLSRQMKESELDSFRSSLDANYDWPCLYPFKFIVPKDQSDAVLELFADDPVQSNESSTGRFIAYTMEMNVHSCDEVIAIYQRVARVPGIISL